MSVDAIKRLNEILTDEQKESINKGMCEPADPNQLENLKRMLKKPNTATIEGWVCRDKDGTLCIYYTKPMRGKEEWFGNYDRQLPEDSFPSLTWHDDPIEVEIQIKPKKQ